MPTLFETLGNAGPAQAQPQDNTQQLSKMVAVGTTGKEQTPTSGAKQSALGEASALDQTKQMMDQLNAVKTQQNVQQQYQAQQIDRETQIQNKAMDQAFLSARENYLSKSGEMLDNLENNRKMMKQEDVERQMEAISAATRLANDRYVFNLELEADRERLDNQIAFDTQLKWNVFGRNIDLMSSDIHEAIDLNRTENERRIALANISAEDALAYTISDLDGQQQAAIWKGVGVAVEGGAKAYATYTPTKTDTTDNKDTTTNTPAAT